MCQKENVSPGQAFNIIINFDLASFFKGIGVRERARSSFFLLSPIAGGYVGWRVFSFEKLTTPVEVRKP